MICKEYETKLLYDYEFSEDETLVILYNRATGDRKEVSYEDWLDNFYIISKI